MERIRARDADALETLYDGHHRLVYGIALRMLGDPSGAEDVTQSVFLKIWSSPDVFREGSFPAWIARVTRNRALDVLRTRALRSESEFADSIPTEGAFEETVLEHVDAERARGAMAQLPVEQREAIELGFFGGCTHEEIARRTGAPLGTVKTRIRSGLQKLRIALSGVNA